MNDVLRGVWCCCGGGLLFNGLLVALLVRRALRRPRRHYKVGYDAMHPLPDTQPRPVPPVVPPPDLSARYTGRLAVYGADILDIPHGARTGREFPYCDWQGTVQERRN